MKYAVVLGMALAAVAARANEVEYLWPKGAMPLNWRVLPMNTATAPASCWSRAVPTSW